MCDALCPTRERRAPPVVVSLDQVQDAKAARMLLVAAGHIEAASRIIDAVRETSRNVSAELAEFDWIDGINESAADCLRTVAEIAEEAA